ncbi:MAG: hypothetical protein RR382_00875 [Tannerellaceae bacterium]
MATAVTTLIAIIAVLVGLVNIITQVIKKITWDKIPSSLLAFIVSELLTVVAFFAYMAYFQYAIVWYYVVAAVIVGFMVTFAAMFGFDKLKEIMVNWENIKGLKLARANLQAEEDNKTDTTGTPDV